MPQPPILLSNSLTPLVEKGDITLKEGERLNPHLRMIVSAVRSGSTALVMALLNNEHVYKALYQSIKTGLREMGVSDLTKAYLMTSLWENIPEGQILVNKETFGPYNEAEASFPIYPIAYQEEAIQIVRPIYLFRDPLQILSAMIRRNWINSVEGGPEKAIEILRIAFDNLFSSFDMAKSISDQHVLGITYEDISDPEKQSPTLHEICRNWDIPYDERMLNWELSFEEAASDRIIIPKRKFIGGSDFNRLIGRGDFDTLATSKTLKPTHTKVDIPREIRDLLGNKLEDAKGMYNQVAGITDMV